MNHWLRLRRTRNVKFYLEIPGTLSPTLVEVGPGAWQAHSYVIRSAEMPFWNWVMQDVSLGHLGLSAILHVEVSGMTVETWPMIDIDVLAYDILPTECEVEMSWTPRITTSKYLP